MKLLLSLSLLLIFIPALNGASFKDSEAQMEKVRKLHLLGVEGDKKAVDQAIHLLTPLLNQDPENSLYQVYKGSCLTLKARYAYWPPKKLDFARLGFATMDQAVERAPKNNEVRFIRAMCGLNVPKFFKRLNLAMEDFDFLVSSLDKVDEKNEDGAMIYYYAALGYLKMKNKNKARRLLNRAMAIDTGSRWKEASQELIKKL